MVTELREDRTGLGRFDVTPAPVIRTPARNPDGSVICPECGQSVTDTRGTQRIRQPDLADRKLREKLDEPLLTHGWVCTRHQYDVITPRRCRGTDASNLPGGWIGVRLVFADETVRWVPTPERELQQQGIER
jgi:hypothetical protein